MQKGPVENSTGPSKPANRWILIHKNRELEFVAQAYRELRCFQINAAVVQRFAEVFVFSDSRQVFVDVVSCTYANQGGGFVFRAGDAQSTSAGADFGVVARNTNFSQQRELFVQWQGAGGRYVQSIGFQAGCDAAINAFQFAEIDITTFYAEIGGEIVASVGFKAGFVFFAKTVAAGFQFRT